MQLTIEKLRLLKSGILSVVLLLFLVGSLAFFPMQAEAFQSFTVKSIRITGLHRVSEGAVLEDLPIQVGQTITEANASEAIQALYKTGFFKDVTLSRDGNTLVVHVVERPTISKLTILGVKDKDKVLKQLREAGLAEGQLFDPALLLKAEKELERFYLSKGKYAVRIVSKVSEETDSLVDIQLDIYEGDAAKIREIKIIGNTAFTEKELTKEFRSCRSHWLSWFYKDDQYYKDKFAADLEILRSYYLDRGYIHFQIESTQVSLSPDKKDIYIAVYISEGCQYTFGDIDITGHFVVPKCKLLPLIAPLQGNPIFSRKVLLDIKQVLETRMGDEGYSISEARPDHQIDEACKKVNIVFELIPGRRMYVNRIFIRGNVTTKDEVIRREMPQMEGTWISSALVREGRENILRRGFGSEVEIETMPVAESPDKVDLIYNIEEARLGQVAAGLGYSDSEKLMFNFALTQENFFGTGKGVGFNFDKSRSTTNYAVDYSDPYFTVDGIGMGFGAYYQKCHLSKSTDITNYTADTLGTDFRWIFPLSRFSAFRAGIGFDDIRLKLPKDRFEVAREVLFFTDRFGKRFEEGVVNVGWMYDSRDQPLFPRRGMSHALTLRTVVPGANQRYYRITLDSTLYQPIACSERWILSFNGNLGYGDGYGRYSNGQHRFLPFYRNFFAGGSHFVRGYEENSLGPKETLQGPDKKAFFGPRAIGGNTLIAGSVSLIFPNPIVPDAKSVRTALFFDAGQVYDTRFRHTKLNGQEVSRNPQGLRYSVGLSLTWHTPLGGAPLTFSLAKPLNAKKGDKKRYFTFWMGGQF